MRPGGSASDKLFASLEQFRQTWPKSGWSWDYRLNTVASSFHVELAEEAHRVISGAMPDLYDSRSLSKAPQQIRDVAENSGGVRSDQRIYVLPTSGRLIAYGLWWPWGDEITISMRIGLAGYVGETDHERLRTQFNAIG